MGSGFLPEPLGVFKAFSSFKRILLVYFEGFFWSILFGSISSPQVFMELICKDL
jgi:hypothetical protein